MLENNEKKEELNGITSKGRCESTFINNNHNKTHINIIKKQKTNFNYQYGNYSRYYGYRKNDNRLEYLKEEWFKDKIALDIGKIISYKIIVI
jgi:hypothetical protein